MSMPTSGPLVVIASDLGVPPCPSVGSAFSSSFLDAGRWMIDTGNCITIQVAPWSSMLSSPAKAVGLCRAFARASAARSAACLKSSTSWTLTCDEAPGSLASLIREPASRCRRRRLFMMSCWCPFVATIGRSPASSECPTGWGNGCLSMRKAGYSRPSPGLPQIDPRARIAKHGDGGSDTPIARRARKQAKACHFC